MRYIPKLRGQTSWTKRAVSSQLGALSCAVSRISLQLRTLIAYVDMFSCCVGKCCIMTRSFFARRVKPIADALSESPSRRWITACSSLRFFLVLFEFSLILTEAIVVSLSVWPSRNRSSYKITEIYYPRESLMRIEITQSLSRIVSQVLILLIQFLHSSIWLYPECDFTSIANHAC